MIESSNVTDIFPGIRDGQEPSGIFPATGDRARILNDLSNAAFEAIKIIELERSGIRDGDGYWDGSDVIGGMASRLIELSNQLLRDRSAGHTIAMTLQEMRALREAETKTAASLTSEER